MKKSQTFLAYYSVLIASSLIIWSLFMAPKPDGFILAVLILPISIYFWILVSGKMPRDERFQTAQSTAENKSIGLMITIAMTISTASILLYIALAGGSQGKTDITDKQSEITSTLSTIKSDTTAIKRGTNAMEKIATKLKLVESSLLKLENDNETRLDMLSTIASSTPTPSTSPTPTPITKSEP